MSTAARHLPTFLSHNVIIAEITSRLSVVSARKTLLLFTSKTKQRSEIDLYVTKTDEKHLQALNPSIFLRSDEFQI